MLFHAVSTVGRHALRRHCARIAVRALATDGQQQRVAVLPASLSSLGLKYLERGALRQQFDKYDVDDSGSIDTDEALQLLLVSCTSLVRLRRPLMRNALCRMHRTLALLTLTRRRQRTW